MVRATSACPKKGEKEAKGHGDEEYLTI